jgi:malate synthase
LLRFCSNITQDIKKQAQALLRSEKSSQKQAEELFESMMMEKKLKHAFSSNPSAVKELVCNNVLKNYKKNSQVIFM